MPVIINGTTGVTFPNGVTMSDGTSAPVTVAQGGTGANTASAARTSLGVAIGTDVLAPNGSGANLTSLNATSISAGTLSNDRLGTVSVAKGGTGVTTVGTSGNVLTSNGSAWVSQALPAGGVTSLNGQTGAITNTDYNAIGSYITGWDNSISALINTNYTSANTTTAGSNILIQANNSNAEQVGWGNFIWVNASTSAGLSGTWRRMTPFKNQNQSNNDYRAPFLFVRIS
jgi:hypothetical protein